MDYHQNARLAVHSREEMCESVVVTGLMLKLAAATAPSQPYVGVKIS
jgi:hypothetical protein